MSRFQEVSDTIYVGYNQNDLKNYTESANTDISCNTKKKIYDGINSEFNPDVVPTFKYNDTITPRQPFYGPNGLSLQLDTGGNVFLHSEKTNGNLWNTRCNNNIFDGSRSGFYLTNNFECINGRIVGIKDNDSKDIANNLRPNNILLNPSCRLDIFGNLICSSSTPLNDKIIPYMAFVNNTTSSSYESPKLIINGDYALNTSINGISTGFDNATGKSMVGNLTILDSTNHIINTSIHANDLGYLKSDNKPNLLQDYFDNSERCNNATSATGLIEQHNQHLASEQVKKDTDIAYNIQYINTINLGIGIFITIGYIYFLYKKKA
jgi:hypothetical protein